MTTLRPSFSDVSRDFEVTLAGEVDVARESDLALVVSDFRAAQAASARVDLRSVTFLDTAGLTFLGLLRDIASTRGGSVEVVGASGACLRTLTLVGFDSEFHLTA